MGNYRIDPKKQFSKKLARWTAVFWFVYMILLLVLMYLQPSVALYCFYMGLVTTVVMIVNEIAYTHNSELEKICFAILDKTQLELKLGEQSTDTKDTTHTEPAEEELDHHDDGEVIEDEHGGEG